METAGRHTESSTLGLWKSKQKRAESKRKPGLERWPPRGWSLPFYFFYLFLGFAQRVSLSQSWTVEQRADRGAAGRTAKTPQRCALPWSCAWVRWTQSSITEAWKNELRFKPVPWRPQVPHAWHRPRAAKTWKLNWGMQREPSQADSLLPVEYSKTQSLYEIMFRTSRVQKMIQHTKSKVKVTNFQGKTQQMLTPRWPDVGIFQDKKAAKLHEVKVNTLEMNGKMKFFLGKQKLWKRTGNFPIEEHTIPERKKVCSVGSTAKQRWWGKESETLKINQYKSSNMRNRETLGKTCETTVKGLTYVLLEPQK